jgi:mannan endo-1,4-beta-mannosidase
MKLGKIAVCLLAVMLVMNVLPAAVMEAAPVTMDKSQENGKAGEDASESTAAGTRLWDFEDSAAGLGGWGVEGSWEYPGGFTLDQISYDPSRKAMKITGLSFDSSKAWSEIKLNIPLKGLSLKGLGLFSMELTVNNESYHAGGGGFRVQPTAILEGGTYKALGNGSPVAATLNPDGTATLLFEISFVSELTIDSLTVGIVGSNTSFKGDMLVDNVLLAARKQGEYMGVNLTVKPVNGRPPQNAAIDTTQPIPLADENATPETKSLFVYLRDVGKTYTLFGHQNAMHHGVSIDKADGSESDVKNAVGSHPAVVGIDGLSLFGGEGTYNQSVTIAKAAYKAGAILTMSMHMPNFETGGMYNDVTAGAVRNVLPGGKAHDKLLAYLDTVAAFAKNCVAEDGKYIPILLRPYHELNGGWFWWGIRGGSADEIRQLYRFTVEYLRDTKGVHSFLYAYSPNGPVTSAKSYLERYPGDDYVDVLGFDYYCDDAGKNTASFMGRLMESCAVVTSLADARGKISAVCETGVRQLKMGYEGLALRDNQGCMTWFTDILDALSLDERASRISYFLVWANFNDSQFFVPYVRSGDKLSHEMADNFIAFYNDNRVVFADRTGDIYSYGNVPVRK